MPTTNRPTSAPLQSKGGGPAAAATAEPFKLDKSKMFGLLHDSQGQVVRHTVRILKIGFGLAAGPDVHVYLSNDDPEKPWVIEQGFLGPDKRPAMRKVLYATKEQAINGYLLARKTALKRNYPKKFPYWTFQRMGIDGEYYPDFDAIESHGPKPHEIDIVFLNEDPLQASYQAWTAANLKCEGNGRDALRRVDWAQTPGEKAIAEQYRQRGEQWFPILGGCYDRGCPFARGEKPVCKPHGRLYAQLKESPRIGGSCTYDTTGFRAIKQLFACLHDIRTMTGGGIPERGTIMGIPLTMVLRPYKVTHEGKPSIQFAPSLEFRAKNALELTRMLNAHASEFHSSLMAGRQAPEPERRAIAAVPEILPAEAFAEAEQTENVSPFASEEQEAQAMTREFYLPGPAEDEEIEAAYAGDDEGLPAEADPSVLPPDDPFLTAAPAEPAPANVSAPPPVSPAPEGPLPDDQRGPWPDVDVFPLYQFEELEKEFIRNRHGQTRAHFIQFLATWNKTVGELKAHIAKRKSLH